MYEIASWQSDILGAGYEITTLAMGRDYEGEVIATLVRRQSGLAGAGQCCTCTATTITSSRNM